MRRKENKRRKKKKELDRQRRDAQRLVRPHAENSMDRMAVGEAHCYRRLANEYGLLSKDSRGKEETIVWMRLNRTHLYEIHRLNWRPNRRKTPLFLLAECAE